MAYYDNYTNDPQQDWEEPDCEKINENCPHCGSDRKVMLWMYPADESTEYECKDCNKTFLLKL